MLGNGDFQNMNRDANNVSKLKYSFIDGIDPCQLTKKHLSRAEWKKRFINISNDFLYLIAFYFKMR